MVKQSQGNRVASHSQPRFTGRYLHQYEPCIRNHCTVFTPNTRERTPVCLERGCDLCGGGDVSAMPTATSPSCWHSSGWGQLLSVDGFVHLAQRITRLVDMLQPSGEVETPNWCMSISVNCCLPDDLLIKCYIALVYK